MAKQRAQYRRYTRSKFGNFMYGLFLVLAGAFSVLPLFYCIVTSLKPLDELLIFPPKFFVSRPTFSNYLVLPSLLNKLQVPMARYIFNSFFISISATVLHIIAASLAAFSFAKSKLKFKNIIFLIVQVMLLFNHYTLAVPQYLIFSKLHLIDTYWVYILPAIPSAMGCFLMKQFIEVGIPNALLEAARIDGAGIIRIFWQIIMPVVKPAWMTLMLFSFRDLWSIVPQGTVLSEELKTLPQVMNTVTQGGIARTGSSMALTVILMIPPIIVFMFSQGSVVETMSSSGIKE
mgnify:CR=1 FL=1